MRSVFCALMLSLIALTLRAGAKLPDSEQHGCAGRPEYHRLDFWLGDWNVYAGGVLDGQNRIATILRGCAIEERWSDASGYEGRSWFYVDPASHNLKQVWLTEHADQPGGIKEKFEIPGQQAGIRLQGKLSARDGSKVFDRTTLTPLSRGRVRQLIETSRDGKSWTTAYDAEYIRAP